MAGLQSNNPYLNLRSNNPFLKTQPSNPFLNDNDGLKLRDPAPVVRKPVPVTRKTVPVTQKQALVTRKPVPIANVTPVPVQSSNSGTIEYFEKEVVELNKLREKHPAYRGETLSPFSDEKSKTETVTIQICRVPTSSSISIPESLGSRSARLSKPVIIPSVCTPVKYRFVYGLPFVRAYPECLLAYDISQESFAAFIDEFNILKRGHVQTFKNVTRVGKVIHLAGHFDPSFITASVGGGIRAAGELGAWASCEGPLALQKRYLDKINKSFFHPKSLHVSVVDTTELRKRLRLSKEEPLMLPLNPEWVIPSDDHLKIGQRCNPRAPHRIVHALRDHVQPIQLLRECNPLAEPLAPEFSADDMYFADAPVLDEETCKQQRSANARDVRNIQVNYEIAFQKARREALALLNAANAVKGTSKEEVKIYFDLLKKAKAKDLEVHSTKKMKWLFITNI